MRDEDDEGPIGAREPVGTAREPLGEILLGLGAVSADRLREALAEQGRQPGARIGQLLDVEEVILSRALALQYGLPWTDALPEPNLALCEKLPRELLASGAVVPLREQGDAVEVAIADPTDRTLLERLTIALGAAVLPVVVPRESLAAALGRVRIGLGGREGAATESADEDGPLEMSAGLEAITDERLADERFPIARLVNGMLFEAVKQGASDIHVEPRADGVQVKFRLDGVLVPRFGRMRSRLLAPLVGRIKVLARLDVAETRVPQDGRFRVWVAGREVDFRVAILPTILGESAVLRILDRKSTLLSLEALGFEALELARFREQVRAPYGMVLVSGPTGSGKTTTLYAAIRDVYREGDKWITIEEPVEYLLDGVIQIPVNPKKGVTFAHGLRAIVRQDPDRLMVGEIRDRETAEIAVNAAMTGHLVLSTIHANNVMDTLGRMRHLGIEAYQMASAFSLLMAQRLVRKLCGECRRIEPADTRVLAGYGLTQEQFGGEELAVAVGCAQCNGTGYKGRRSIFELLVMTDEIRERLLAGDSLLSLRERARAAGMRELRDRALQCVRGLETSPDEMVRVTRE
ncbi:MAG: Flp pilus assembly complex ATPase component TadA [Candidatus Wallbacteria bacterium]|nr:Flp pilus assembly complex ATPase component TadA [Candidatus Wallbacteria bacterium]